MSLIRWKLVDELFSVGLPIVRAFLSLGFPGAIAILAAMTVAGWLLCRSRVVPVWLRATVLVPLWSVIGLVGLTLMRYGFDWLFFRQILGDGQYGFIWIITIPFGALLGAVTGAALALSSRARL